VAGDIIGHCEKNVKMKMCLTVNVYRDRAVWIYKYKSDARNKKDRHCTCNVILRRVSATIVEVRKQQVLHIWVCVCILRYPAFNEHAPYCHLWYV